MEERRKFLQAVPWAALGVSAVALSGGAAELVAAAKKTHLGSAAYDPRKQRSVPDVPGVAHTGKSFRFYGDLVKDKVVAINFMSIRGEAHYPVTARMSDIARRLGDKLGHEVFMVSVTRDSEHDTPERLAAFAAEHRIPKGWLLVNCSADGAHALQSRIYHHHSSSQPALMDHSSGLQHAKVDTVFYGNGGVGLWSNFPINLQPDEAVRHISWVMPGSKPVGQPHRAGPRRLDGRGLRSDNRIAQNI
jgi:cytochrome oxidase Cu insertion factor (SCO1/SenC/PrrC family)